MVILAVLASIMLFMFLKAKAQAAVAASKADVRHLAVALEAIAYPLTSPCRLIVPRVRYTLATGLVDSP